MPTLRNLYREYIDDLRNHKIEVGVHSGAAKWTESVKTYWARKGNENGFLVNANRIKYDNENFIGHEYILDVIWRTDTEQTKQIQLALECEWQTGIKFQEKDFRKLIFVKAKQKVFIFQVLNREILQNRIKELQRCIKQCRIGQEPKEEYLLIGHIDGPDMGGYRIDILHGFIGHAAGDFRQMSDECVKIK